MSALQESRRELMVQLEGLMRLLKVIQHIPAQRPAGVTALKQSSALISLKKSAFEALEAFLIKCEADLIQNLSLLFFNAHLCWLIG